MSSMNHCSRIYTNKYPPPPRTTVNHGNSRFKQAHAERHCSFQFSRGELQLPKMYSFLVLYI